MTRDGSGRPLPIGKVPPEALDEFVYRHLGARRADVLVHASFGEDCAVVDFGGGAVAVTTDPITGAGEDLGWYAILIGTNDLAAAGAEPVAVVITILLPPARAADDLARVMRDAGAAAASLGVEIAGGHSEVVGGLERTIVVVTALGRVMRDRLLRSGAARSGDAVLLTKAAGVEGTAILADLRRADLVASLGEAGVSRARAFRERLSVLPEARAAAAAGAHAMHDVTEGGVLGAVYEIAAASGLGVLLDADRVPVLPETKALCDLLGVDPLALIGSGALLVATPEPDRTAAAIAKAGVPATVIATLGPGQRRVRRAGREESLVPPARDELWRVLSQ
ncbi:MAG TPA: AIR synthase family protein [bacterium]|nr:AIR synthase family protein [bacterium]